LGYYAIWAIKPKFKISNESDLENSEEKEDNNTIKPEKLYLNLQNDNKEIENILNQNIQK